MLGIDTTYTHRRCRMKSEMTAHDPAEVCEAILTTGFFPRFYISWKPLVGCSGFLASATFQCLDKGTTIAWLLDGASEGMEMVRVLP